jgi:hypothetical protein
MQPIQFPPGVTHLASKNSEIVNWRESNLIRWDEGVTLKPVGGWEKYLFSIPFVGKIRKMHRWSDNNNVIYTAYMTETHVYVEIGGVLTDITPVGGLPAPAGNNGGYSDDKYNESTYNTIRSGINRLRLYTPTYTLGNWGQELRAMTSADGRLLRWDPAAPTSKLTAVLNAPVGNRSFVITPERHIMLFGMGGAFDKYGWSDKENDTNWAFTDILSRAGFYEVSPKSPIVTHQMFEGGILVWTPAMSYLVTWVGLPYVYSYRPLGQIPIPISPASVCEVPMGVAWASVDGFWLFDGSNAKVIECSVWDYIDANVDIPAARFMAACVHVSNKGEVWWFFPSLDKPNGNNSRYVCFDSRSFVWSVGKLSRTCGFVYGNDRYTVMSDGVDVWKHEVGNQYPGAEELPWIESMNLNPNGGENWITVNKILPDIKGNSDAIRFILYKTNDRNEYTPETQSPPRKKNGNGWVDFRETARDMRLRIQMVEPSDWQAIGPILFDNKIRGKKGAT